jgi:hypothetical protein
MRKRLEKLEKVGGREKGREKIKNERKRDRWEDRLSRKSTLITLIKHFPRFLKIILNTVIFLWNATTNFIIESIRILNYYFFFVFCDLREPFEGMKTFFRIVFRLNLIQRLNRRRHVSSQDSQQSCFITFFLVFKMVVSELLFIGDE